MFEQETWTDIIGHSPIYFIKNKLSNTERICLEEEKKYDEFWESLSEKQQIEIEKLAEKEAAKRAYPKLYMTFKVAKYEILDKLMRRETDGI